MPPEGRRVTIGVAALVAATIGIVLLAGRSASPLTPPLLDGPPAWLRGAADAIGFERLTRDGAAGVAGLLLLAAAAGFLLLLRAAWRREIRPARVAAIAVLLHAAVLLAPPLFSRDVYSYAVYGRIVSEHGANPYVLAPDDVPGDPFAEVVSPEWADTPSVYGPAFTALSAAITGVSASPAGSVAGFRILSSLASLLTIALVGWAARRLAPDRTAFAMALLGLNPVVLFHTVGGGHNDTLVAAGMAGAVLSLVHGRRLLATAALALAAAIKISAAVPLLIAVAAAAAAAGPRRMRALAAHLGAAAAVVIPFAAPFITAENPTLSAVHLASLEGWLAPSRFLHQLIRRIGEAVGMPGVGEVVGIVVRLAFPVALLAGAALIVRRLVASRGSAGETGAALGWTALLGLLAAPILLPWYVCLVLPVAWLLPRGPRTATIALAIVLALTEVVAEPMRSPPVWEALLLGVHYVASPLALLLFVRLLLDLRDRTRRSDALRDPALVSAATDDRDPPERRDRERDAPSAGGR